MLLLRVLLLLVRSPCALLPLSLLLLLLAPLLLLGSLVLAVAAARGVRVPAVLICVASIPQAVLVCILCLLV
jgi:hypothetical protein